MKAPQVIAALGALAHEHRLAVFRLLVERGPAGLAAGAIGARLGVAPSALTFHLQHLQRAGLATSARAGRQIIYLADYSAINALVTFLTDNCCAESGAPPANCKPQGEAARVNRKPRKAA
jgi:DNA-binding transcriptional ArsR family regulator